MFKRGNILLLLFGMLVSSHVTAEEKLKLYTLLFKPYTFKSSNGNMVGATIETFELLSKRMGHQDKPKIIPLPPKRIPHALKNEKNVLLLPLTRRDNRDVFADWLFHFNDGTGNFITLNNKNFSDDMSSLKTLKNISGVTIGVMRGSTFNKTLTYERLRATQFQHIQCASKVTLA